MQQGLHHATAVMLSSDALHSTCLALPLAVPFPASLLVGFTLCIPLARPPPLPTYVAPALPS